MDEFTVAKAVVELSVRGSVDKPLDAAARKAEETRRKLQAINATAGATADDRRKLRLMAGITDEDVAGALGPQKRGASRQEAGVVRSLLDLRKARKDALGTGEAAAAPAQVSAVKQLLLSQGQAAQQAKRLALAAGAAAPPLAGIARAFGGGGLAAGLGVAGLAVGGAYAGLRAFQGAEHLGRAASPAAAYRAELVDRDLRASAGRAFVELSEKATNLKREFADLTAGLATRSSRRWTSSAP
jgi:hypothetical protein